VVLSSTVPSVAAEWPAERARLIEAAEKEGSLVLYMLPNQLIREAVQHEWARDFPKISMSGTVMRHPLFIARIRTERGAGKYLWDAGLTGWTSGYVLSKEGTVDPLLPEMVDPDVSDPKVWGGWDEAFVDIDRKYVFAMSSYLSSPQYNALLLSPEKVARQGLKVMLDPELKGKIAWNDPAVPGSGLTFVYQLRKGLGEHGFKTLITEQQVAFMTQQHLVVEAMARGTAWIGMGPPVRRLMEPYLKAGVKADIRPLGSTPETATLAIGGQTLYVFNKRPHPAATRLFVNWLLSRDVQDRLARTQDLNSRRSDVTPVALPDERPIPGVKYDTLARESFDPEIEQGIELIKKYREAAK
jgi:iron(III) transport system substrate-binding protein